MTIKIITLKKLEILEIEMLLLQSAVIFQDNIFNYTQFFESNPLLLKSPIEKPI